MQRHNFTPGTHALVADAGQAVFKLPIYDSLLQPPNLFGVLRSSALAPFRRLGQRILYKWYGLQDEKL